MAASESISEENFFVDYAKWMKGHDACLQWGFIVCQRLLSVGGVRREFYTSINCLYYPLTLSKITLKISRTLKILRCSQMIWYKNLGHEENETQKLKKT